MADVKISELSGMTILSGTDLFVVSEYLSSNISGDVYSSKYMDYDSLVSNISGSILTGYQYIDKATIQLSPNNYTSISNDLSGHLSGIDNTLGDLSSAIDNITGGVVGDFIPLSGSDQIAGNLTPNLSTLTLGTASNPWSSVFVSSASIHLGDKRFHVSGTNALLNDEWFMQTTELPQITDQNKPVFVQVTTHGDVGDGSDGDLAVTVADTVVNNYTDLVSDVTASSQTLSARNASLFSIGEEILIIQIQNFRLAGETNLGKYEIATISNIVGNSITVNSPLTNSYYSDSDGNKANNTKSQIVSVPNYNSVTIGAGTSITCDAWDGYKGGIVIFKCLTNLAGDGTINVNYKGYNPCGAGNQGEGYKGRGISSTNQNYGGGGGYGGGFAPGDGGHALSGESYHGIGGQAFGDSNLLQSLTLGGAGGDRGSIWPDLQHGGGIIAVYATNITIPSMTARGQDPGINDGGAGAGGSILIYGSTYGGTLDVGANYGGSVGYTQNTIVQAPSIKFYWWPTTMAKYDSDIVYLSSAIDNISGGGGSVSAEINALSSAIDTNTTHISELSSAIDNISGANLSGGNYQYLDSGGLQLSATNYIPTSGNISGHLNGLDNALSNLVSGLPVYGQVYRTTSKTVSAVNTWFNVEFDSDNDLYNIVHSTSANTERVQVNYSGVYEINYCIHFSRGTVPHHHVSRLVKNNSTEIVGSFRQESTLASDANERNPVVGSCITSLLQNDYVTLQMGTNTIGAPEINLYDDFNLPDPTTSIYAMMTIKKL